MLYIVNHELYFFMFCNGLRLSTSNKENDDDDDDDDDVIVAVENGFKLCRRLNDCLWVWAITGI